MPLCMTKRKKVAPPHGARVTEAGKLVRFTVIVVINAIVLFSESPVSHVMWKRVFLRAVGVGGVLIQYGCIAHCTLEFVGDFVVCTGPSMMPTIKSNDIVITEHISVGRRNIEVGDIVVARSPHNPTQHICKRVLGLEGDWIDNPPPHYSHRYIPKGYVWLEGDNKDNSTDSRSYGPVPYALLRSRVFFKVWPVHDIGSMSHNYGKERNN